MNPRVKELAEQAGGVVLAGSEIQKFAELIVQECADIVEQDMKLAHIQMIPLTLENDKGTVSIGDRQWLESLQSRWESHEYQELWTAECQRIRKEESQLTIKQVVERTDESAPKVRRMKWRSLFNPTRRTLLIGDWIYRLKRIK